MTAIGYVGVVPSREREIEIERERDREKYREGERRML